MARQTKEQKLAQEKLAQEKLAQEKLAELAAKVAGMTPEQLASILPVLPDTHKTVLKQAFKPAKEPKQPALTKEEKDGKKYQEFSEMCFAVGRRAGVLAANATQITNTADIKRGDIFFRFWAQGAHYTAMKVQHDVVDANTSELTLAWIIDDGINGVGDTGAWAAGRFSAKFLNFKDPKTDQYTKKPAFFSVWRQG